ncbi:MAG TPA: DUF1731 domain-containing protein, partial [Myxococcaceae bacterium]|nr:DUF1731 domain-containing protein [Myxococcaceae bacterium]
TREWEEATAPAREAGIRVVLLRIGMVLSPAGGALGALLPPFKAGAGGPVGSGKQWQSWISIEDLVGAIHFALMNDGFHGPANAVAGSLTNRDFSRTLAHVLHRPSVMPLPGAALGAVLGEMGRELLLAGQRVRPAALEGAGFHFAFPELEGALRFLLGAA